MNEIILKKGMNEIILQTDGSLVRVRVKRAQRDQIRWRDAALDQLVPKDHRVRAVWACVDSRDLKARSQEMQAVEGASGSGSTWMRSGLARAWYGPTRTSDFLRPALRRKLDA